MVLQLLQDPNMVRHQGGCHCRAVRFQVLAPPTITVYQCNCSICVKKQYKYLTVPFAQFKLVTGHDALRTYTFDDDHAAKYNFCATCGVQVLHLPNDDPETYGLALHCLDEGTVKKVNYEKVDAKGQPRRKTSFIEQLSSKTQQVTNRRHSATDKPDPKTLLQQTRKLSVVSDSKVDDKQQQKPPSTRKLSSVVNDLDGKSRQNRKILLIDRFDIKKLAQSTRKISITTLTVDSSDLERSA